MVHWNGKLHKMRSLFFRIKKKFARIEWSKVKVRSPDGNTEYFDIVAGVLQGDTLATYLFIICLDYVLRTSIDKIRENGFELTKKRSRRYYLPTPPLGQDMTQGQFLSGV